MSTQVTIQQTKAGWLVDASDPASIQVETDGATIIVTVEPENFGGEKPLDVTLETPTK